MGRTYNVSIDYHGNPVIPCATRTIDEENGYDYYTIGKSSWIFVTGRGDYDNFLKTLKNDSNS